VVNDPLVFGTNATQAWFMLAPEDDFESDLSLSTQFRAYPYFVLAYDALIIHRRAVHSEGLRHFVYLYDNGKLHKRYISIGISLGTSVQVLFGLEEGQQVVMQ
jgi:hypothetical protein